MNICGGFNIGSGTAGNFGYLTGTGSYKRKRDNKAQISFSILYITFQFNQNYQKHECA